MSALRSCLTLVGLLVLPLAGRQAGGGAGDLPLPHLREEAAQGDLNAQFQMGENYFQGAYGVKRDYEEAYAWYKKAAARGLMAAQYMVSRQLALGLGVKVDPVEAMHWCRLAAEQGLAEAQFDLGTGYLNGRGLKASVPLALAWFQKAADQGFARAQNALGDLYAQGLGVRQSWSEAASWYERAALQGLAEAEYHLGCLCEAGLGHPRDCEAALSWLKKAAEQKFTAAVYDLQARGRSWMALAPSYAPGAKPREDAAAQGSAKAQMEFGLAYLRGRPADYGAAIPLLRLAATYGYPEAEYALATCLFEEDRMGRNGAEALHWLKRAALHGEKAAWPDLAGRLFMSVDGSADLVEAYAWYTLLAEGGGPREARNLAALAPALSEVHLQHSGIGSRGAGLRA